MGNSLTKLLKSNSFLTKVVALNGVLDLVFGLNVLLINSSKASTVNASLALSTTSPYSRRSSAWLLLTVGLMRIIGYWYPKEIGPKLCAYWSYLVEATWMFSETVYYGSTSHLGVSLFLYIFGFIVRGQMKRQIKQNKGDAASPTIAAAQFRVGDRVSAKAIGWQKHYDGKVIAVSQKNSSWAYDVKFDDGEIEKNLRPSQVKKCV